MKNKLSKEEIKISKFISMLLRHKPELLGLELQEDGFAYTDELIKKIKL